jgi:hypothetical protein
VIAYEYEVDGRTYGSDVIHARLSSSKSSFRAARDAERYGERYPVGAAVAVAYDPADPANAMLEPDGGGGVVVGVAVAVAIGFLLIGACFAGVLALALVAGD